ncbi:hypothetical protein [Fontivita pretiosa]|uniref:hypothetical protein n=1 Tax=Fontivita pretiosa TaxID=2989684 RepID=UPI003D16D886
MIKLLIESLLITVFMASVYHVSPAAAQPAQSSYFVIEVVDDVTGRGVPLVELKTTNHICYYTDSNGIVAFNEPGMMDCRVWFYVSSHGYEFPADGFGFRGVTLETKPGGSATLKIKRINIAERLYRVTGQGIYRDSVLAGRKAPIRQPLLNGGVFGQDSVLATVYRGRIYWFWGDTNRAWYPLGNFHTSGATSLLPGKGGLDPSVGVDLEYFVDEEGFSKKMAPMSEPGPVWLGGLLVLKDNSGNERMLAHFSRMKNLGERLERGLMVYNDQTNTFEKLKNIDLDAPLAPDGHPFTVTTDAGQRYFYFPQPYPNVRVLADWDHVTDVSTYEGYTCLEQGARYDKDSPKLDRDQQGRVVFSWKKGTPPLTPTQLAELIDSGKLRREDCPMRLTDVDTGKPILLHGGSVYWNEFRKRWIMIGLEGRGTSMLGEIWFADAPAPEGPWTRARKIVTHDRQDFYNPTQHPFFDQQGGRFIYFEGTYTNSFSGNPIQTPRYEYNQIMYRLDLADPRLSF